MTTLPLDVGHRLLAAPLAVAVPEVLDLVAAQPPVRAVELVLDGRVVARSGKPSGAATLVFPLAGPGELRIACDDGADPAPYTVVAQLLALALRAELAVAEERRGIADDLHDGLLQTLVAARLMPRDDVLRGAVAEARDLMRSLRQRQPAVFAGRPARRGGLTTESGAA